jgi:hypothetical protein
MNPEGWRYQPGVCPVCGAEMNGKKLPEHLVSHAEGEGTD